MRRIFILTVILLGMNFTDWKSVSLTNHCFAQLWVARYNGPGNDDDEPSGMVVDNDGSVYVTGYSMGSDTHYDYATIKYNSSGDTLWTARCDGRANGIAIDNDGNIYVTGASWDSTTHDDYTTIKYSPSGDTLWVRKYNGPGNYSDCASAIAIDNKNNVYVTGSVINSITGDDYVTIKYNPSGNTLWVSRHNGLSDGAKAITVDNDGNVYVTGRSDISTSYYDDDYLTVKYDSLGVEQWTARFDYDTMDYAAGIAVDRDGNVYVTGRPATIKYNPLGEEQWREYSLGLAITVDDSGYIYVTGPDWGLGNDCETIKYNSSGDTVWIATYDGPDSRHDRGCAIVIDKDYNVYVTGYSHGSGTSADYVTIKYNSLGIEQWVERYNGPGNGYDRPYAIALDDSGNVYVTGSSRGSGTDYDYVTIKYSCAEVEERNERLEIRDWRLQIYPNPFTTVVRVQWSGVSEGERVSLKIYDLSGRLVKRLLNNEVIPGNKIEVRLDELTNGIYFVKMEAGDFKATKKLTILR